MEMLEDFRESLEVVNLSIFFSYQLQFMFSFLFFSGPMLTFLNINLSTLSLLSLTVYLSFLFKLFEFKLQLLHIILQVLNNN